MEPFHKAKKDENSYSIMELENSQDLLDILDTGLILKSKISKDIELVDSADPKNEPRKNTDLMSESKGNEESISSKCLTKGTGDIEGIAIKSLGTNQHESNNLADGEQCSQMKESNASHKKSNIVTPSQGQNNSSLLAAKPKTETEVGQFESKANKSENSKVSVHYNVQSQVISKPESKSVSHNRNLTSASSPSENKGNEEFVNSKFLTKDAGDIEGIAIKSLGTNQHDSTNMAGGEQCLQMSDDNASHKKSNFVIPISEGQNNSSLLTPKLKIETQVSEFESKANKSGNSKVIVHYNVQPQVISKPESKSVSNNRNLASASSPTIFERALIKKIIKTDSIKIRYMKQKLKMERDYHNRKLGLMKKLLEVKQRKVKAEEKQATALIRIARSLDRMIQNRH